MAPGAAAEATVCMVLPDGFALMEPSWKGWAWAADMGNEPAGHMQAQLHPPFAAAAAPVAALAPPAPATTVTAAFAAAVVDAAALAVPFPEPWPATNVKSKTPAFVNKDIKIVPIEESAPPNQINTHTLVEQATQTLPQPTTCNAETQTQPWDEQEIIEKWKKESAVTQAKSLQEHRQIWINHTY